MNIIGVFLVLVILFMAFIWIIQLRRLTLKLKWDLKCEEKELSPQKKFFRQMLAKGLKGAFNRMSQLMNRDQMENAKQTGIEEKKYSPANTNNEKEIENLEEDLDKDKNFQPQLNANEDEDEEEEEEDEDLENLNKEQEQEEEEEENQDSLDAQIKKYNKSRGEDDKLSKGGVLVKLFKLLYIEQLTNCHTLYNVSKGKFAFPQNMYNKTVVYQTFILYLVFLISLILSINSVHNATGNDIVSAFMIVTIVTSVIFTTFSYTLRSIHHHIKEKKNVQHELASESSSLNVSQMDEEQKEEHVHAKKQNIKQNKTYFKIYRLLFFICTQLYLTVVCINNLSNSKDIVIENTFLLFFLAIVTDYFFLRPLLIFVVTLVKFFKIVCKNRDAITTLCISYDKQRKIQIEMLLWQRDNLPPTMWQRMFNKNGLLKQVDDVSEEEDNKVGEEEEEVEEEKEGEEEEEEEDEDAEPNSSFLRYEEQQRLNNLSYENEFYMTNSDEEQEKEKEESIQQPQGSNEHSLQTQNSNDRTSFNKQSKMLLMSMQHMSRLEQLHQSKDLQLTNNNLLRDVGNKSQMDLDGLGSNSNILQQNLKNKLDGDNLSQISQDYDIKPNFNKGLNLNISLSMDQNSQHAFDQQNNNKEAEEEDDEDGNNSDSQIMQLNNILQKNQENQSMNTKNLSQGQDQNGNNLINGQDNFFSKKNMNYKGSKGENHFLVKTSSEMKIDKRGVQYSLDYKQNNEFQKLDFNEIEKMYEKEKRQIERVNNTSQGKNKKFKYINEGNFDDQMKQKYQEKSNFISKVYDENNKSLLGSKKLPGSVRSNKKMGQLHPPRKYNQEQIDKQYEEDVFDYDQFMQEQEKHDLLKQKKEFIKIRQPPKSVEREQPQKKKKKKKKKVPVLKINNSKSPYTEYLPKLIDKQVHNHQFIYLFIHQVAEQKTKENKMKLAQVKLSMMISKNDQSIMNPQQVEKINKIASIYNNNKTIIFDNNKTILLNQSSAGNKSVLPKSLGKPQNNNNFMSNQNKSGQKNFKKMLDNSQLDQSRAQALSKMTSNKQNS